MMRKSILLAAAAALLTGCAVTVAEDAPAGEHILVTAGVETKSQIEDGTQVWWSPEDEISVFCGGIGLGKFTSLSLEPSKFTVFASEKTFVVGSLGESPDYYYLAIYPYDAVGGRTSGGVPVTVPSRQIAAPDTFQPGSFPSAGVSKDLSIPFYHLCGGVKFSLCKEGVTSVSISSNAGEPIAGTVLLKESPGDMPPFSWSVSEGESSVIITCPEGFRTGTCYYISLLPAVLSEGFTMTFSTEYETASRSVAASREIKRSVFGNLGTADEGLTYIADAFLQASVPGVYTLTDDAPLPVLTYNEDEDQLTFGVTAGRTLFSVMNFGASPYWGTVCVGAASFLPLETYSASVSIGGAAPTLYDSLVCLRCDDGKVWLENNSARVGIILPVE